MLFLQRRKPHRWQQHGKHNEPTIVLSLTFPMASAVFTGTVLFSTMILEDVDTEAIMRAAPSQ